MASTKMQISKPQLSAVSLDRAQNGSGGGVPDRASSPPSALRRYEQEISQMLFVAGEVKDPLPETLHQVEDIVRSQVVELAVRARAIANRRGSRALVPDDLIFLIRQDKPKVNRLRTFLSWIAVRKATKHTTENIGTLPVQVGAGVAADGQDGLEEPGADPLTTSLPGTVVKLPWEVTSIYSDFLDRHRATFSSAHRAAPDDVDLGIDDLSLTSATELDEQLHQLYRDSLARLKTADEVTKNMSAEEYAYYSDCRQASFTFRKAKRFREFINFSLYLEVKPSDDIIDLLGFLAFEVVHTLGVQALQVKKELDPPPPLPSPSAAAPPIPVSPPQKIEEEPPTITAVAMDIDLDSPTPLSPPPPEPEDDPPAEIDDKKGGLFARPLTRTTRGRKRGKKSPSPSPSLTPPPPSPTASTSDVLAASPPPAPEPDLPPAPPPLPASTSPVKRATSPDPLQPPIKRTRPSTDSSTTTTGPATGWTSLFAPPSTVTGKEGIPARTPLRASHVREAFARIQRREALMGGMSGAAGGRGAPGAGRRREGGLV